MGNIQKEILSDIDYIRIDPNKDQSNIFDLIQDMEEKESEDNYIYSIGELIDYLKENDLDLWDQLYQSIKKSNPNY